VRHIKEQGLTALYFYIFYRKVIDIKDHITAYIFATIHAIIIGFSFMFSKNALKYSQPLDALAFRFSACLIVLMVAVVLKWINVDNIIKNLRHLVGIALFYPIMFFGFQTFGLAYASSSEGGILNATAPVFTMVLSALFLGERTTLAQKCSILLSVSGVIYIFIMKGAGFNFTKVLGILLLVLSNLSLSGYNIIARTKMKQFSVTEVSFIMIVFGFLAFNTAAVTNHILKGTLDQFLTPLGSSEFIISILYLGILSSLVTSMLTNYVLSKIEAARMSVFGNLGTVISIIAGAFFLKEPIYLYHIVGSLMIITGVIGTNYTRLKTKMPDSQNR
jgi:drug/metabolite transporter (DMT)-like permease